MNKNIFTVIFYFLSISIFSQVRVGDFRVYEYGFGKLSKSTVSDFKTTTTYFVINKNLQLTISDFESILSKAWTITPFKVITSDELNQYMKEGNSFVRFNSFSITKTGGLTNPTWSYVVFDVFIPSKIKKTRKGDFKWKTERLASIYFTIDISARQDVVAQKTKIEGDLLNYRLGYLKNNFQLINNSLINKKNINIYDDFKDEKELKKLKRKELYFSEELIYGYNAFTIQDKEEFSADKLFEGYKFKYEIVSDEKINEMILDKNSEEFYYLLYSQINSNKILTIINSKTGNIIFQEHKKMAFNLKPKDIKQLSATIAKAK